jgi:hypothetical protein
MKYRTTAPISLVDERRFVSNQEASCFLSPTVCGYPWDRLIVGEGVMIRTLGTTENFVIKYEDSFAHAERRAEQLKATCESDFDVLKGWFGVTDGFGSTNRTILQVETEHLARNGGYKNDGTSFIRMDPCDGAAVQEEGDDAVQSLFVAEMIEILMSHRNKKTGVTTGTPTRATARVFRVLPPPACIPSVITRCLAVRSSTTG